MPAESPVRLSSVHTRASICVPPPCAKPPTVICKRRRCNNAKYRTLNKYKLYKNRKDMGLFDFFKSKPAWQSNNKEEALRSIDKLTDQSKLIEVIKTAPISDVRKYAMEKLVEVIDDEKTLLQIVLTSDYHIVVEKAFNKLKRLESYEIIALSDCKFLVKQEAMERLNNISILEKALLKSPKSANVKLVSRISNQDTLKAIVEYYFASKEVLETAFGKITDQMWLSKFYCSLDERGGQGEKERTVLAKSLTDRNALEYALKNSRYTYLLENRLAQFRIDEVRDSNNHAEIANRAMNDPSPNVRVEAVKKLTDQNILENIVINDSDKSVRSEAAKRLPNTSKAKKDSCGTLINHDYIRISGTCDGKCSLCGAVGNKISVFHDWDGCVCKICGQQNKHVSKEQHGKIVNCHCVKCGEDMHEWVYLYSNNQTGSNIRECRVCGKHAETLGRHSDNN